MQNLDIINEEEKNAALFDENLKRKKIEREKQRICRQCKHKCINICDGCMNN